MKQLSLLFLIFISFNCYSQSKNEKNIESEDAQSTILQDEFGISLVRLIATPEKYDGKTIQIIGFLNLEFEGNAIYLHKEDYENVITQNAFWVDFSKEMIKRKDIMKYNKKYVIIVGKFNMKGKGHMGMFGGSIENISRLDFWN